MLFLIIGCVFWRNNIAIGTKESTPEVHISSTLRYFHVSGPSVRAHLAPQLQHLSAGWEFSPALIFGSWFPIDEIRPHFLKEVYLLSAIGVDFISLNLRYQKPALGLMSPYFQIHTPAKCTIETKEEMLCFSVFGEAQYHIIKGNPNHATWNAGIAIHYGKGFFPF
jgi:hypothetical protein